MEIHFTLLCIQYFNATVWVLICFQQIMLNQWEANLQSSWQQICIISLTSSKLHKSFVTSASVLEVITTRDKQLNLYTSQRWLTSNAKGHDKNRVIYNKVCHILIFCFPGLHATCC